MTIPHKDPALWRLALGLSLGAAVSLGISRFAYGLLLPPMRADLGWSYTLAGAMNTANAAGYLLGALALPRLLQRLAPVRLLVWGSGLATLFLALTGHTSDPLALMVLRLLAGVASALMFATGGLLAAQLGQAMPVGRSGLVLGLYYGGTGLGIVVSALAVPPALVLGASQARPWGLAWWVLAALAAAATLALARLAPALQAVLLPTAAVAGSSPPTRVRWRALAPALAGYTCFGIGYIGYMTFVIALLRAQGQSVAVSTVFYAALGLAVMGSARLWAGLLDRERGGGALARLNALLAVATGVPALSSSLPWLVASGLLFGAVFLSVVASTTALVRHNLPPADWARGIAAFTVVFAAGQIIGPTLVGWISDGPGGLQRGLLGSALALALGAVLALGQRPLARSGSVARP